MEQELAGTIVIMNEPCYEDLINILLRNNYEVAIKKHNDDELEIKYFIRRKF